MKTINVVLFLMAVAFTSCEEVVDVNLDTAEPRLVIDASIRWQKGTSGTIQYIGLTTTAGYFEDEVPFVSGATVNVSDSQGNVFTFNEVPEIRKYMCTDFIPNINETYTLTVITNGQTYTATETLQSVPAIDYVIQSTNGGFTGDQPEIKFFFTDDGAADNYYLFAFNAPSDAFPDYQVLEDRLVQGNQTFGSYSDDALNSGDNVSFYIAGISERYYNYMRILLSISGNGGGSPFQSPPATVRGNIVNFTDTENYALGYFSLSETDEYTVIVE